MLYILQLESLQERYTTQWMQWFSDACHKSNVDYRMLYGNTFSDRVETGKVLDAYGTCLFKSSQMTRVCELFKTGAIKSGDKFLTFDLWHPGLECIPYMATLGGIDVEVYGFLHAGSYTDGDFAGAMASWAHFFERGWAEICTKIFVGSKYHRAKFITRRHITRASKVVATGNPFDTEAVRQTAGVYLAPVERRSNYVVYPNRWDKEKAPDRFVRIMNILYKRRQDFKVIITTSREKFVAEDSGLHPLNLGAEFPHEIHVGCTKQEYYQRLAESKVFVSTSPEENFGYCLVEAITLGCAPVVTEGVSHNEILMWNPQYLAATDDDFAHKISAQLNKPVPCAGLAERYNASIAHILGEMGCL